MVEQAQGQETNSSLKSERRIFRAPSIGMRMKHAKILVAEDETDIRDLIVLHLEREGHSVTACGNGMDAMRYLAEEAFDLLVLDWMLPEKSGLDILKELRKAAGHEKVAVLMVTARGANSDLVLGLENGADDYLVKPFELSVLMPAPGRSCAGWPARKTRCSPWDPSKLTKPRTRPVSAVSSSPSLHTSSSCS